MCVVEGRGDRDRDRDRQIEYSVWGEGRRKGREGGADPNSDMKLVELGISNCHKTKSKCVISLDLTSSTRPSYPQNISNIVQHTMPTFCSTKSSTLGSRPASLIDTLLSGWRS